MKRVELHARLKSVQQHELIRGKDITTLTAFMDNTELEEHIERFERIIAEHKKKAQSGTLHANPGTN